VKFEISGVCHNGMDGQAKTYGGRSATVTCKSYQKQQPDNMWVGTVHCKQMFYTVVVGMNADSMYICDLMKAE